MIKPFQAVITAIMFIGAVTHAEAEPITIGLMTELSGTYSANGADIKLGWEIARKAFAPSDQINGEPIRFVYADSQGEGKTGVTEFRRLVEMEHVAAVLVNRGPVVAAINPVSSQTQTPILAVSGLNSLIKDNPYAYRFWPSPQVEGAAYAKEFLRRGATKVALVTVQDDYALSVAAGFEDAFKKGNGTIVISEQELESSNDFSALVSKIKSKNPEGIFVNMGISQLPVFINKLRNFNYKGQIAASVWISKPSIIAQVGNEAAEGVFFVEPSFRNHPEFKKAADKLMQEQNVTTASYASFAALGTLLNVIENSSQKPLTPNNINKALNETKSIKLLNAEFPIINREAQFNMEVRTIKNGIPQ